MVRLSLLMIGLLPPEEIPHSVLIGQVFRIFPVSFLHVSGEHPKIAIEQEAKCKKIKDSSPRKEEGHEKQHHGHCQKGSPQCIHPVSSYHKLL